jgi:hypothetical protein
MIASGKNDLTFAGGSLVIKLRNRRARSEELMNAFDSVLIEPPDDALHELVGSSAEQ